MKRFSPLSFCLLLAAVSLARAADAPAPVAPGKLSDEAVAARRAALELAGAFSNDGFKLRDGHWIGEGKKGAPALIRVNLYAGNEYWFSAASSAAGGNLTVSLHDETGAAVEFEPFADGPKAAAGFSPEVSGPYFLKIEWDGAAPASLCALYSYK
jgi:hypothetical protein